MAGQRGRKKRGAHAQDQEVAKSSPFVSRYPKRSEGGVVLIPQLPSEVKLSPSTQSPTHDLYQIQRTQEVPPQSQDKNGDSHMENDAVSVSVQENSTAKSSSLNFTEFANANQDDSDDPDEVRSAPSLSHEIVHGHRVKKEMAPLLRSIFQKYGDITEETTFKSSTFISFVLEQLCGVYQKLETTNLTDLTHVEIAEMVEQLQDMESQKINARWLLKKVEEIVQVKTSLQKYKMFKDGEEKCIQDNLEKRKIQEKIERHVAMIQKRYKDVARAMDVNNAKANECRKMALDIKASVNDDLLKKPLVHGLL